MCTIQPCTSLQCHFVSSYVRKMHVCLAVACRLHFWQNDQDLVRATAVTRGWKRYRNKSAQKVNPGGENSPSNTWRDSNPRSFDHESSALTTEPSPLPTTRPMHPGLTHPVVVSRSRVLLPLPAHPLLFLFFILLFIQESCNMWRSVGSEGKKNINHLPGNLFLLLLLMIMLLMVSTKIMILTPLPPPLSPPLSLFPLCLSLCLSLAHARTHARTHPPPPHHTHTECLGEFKIFAFAAFFYPCPDDSPSRLLRYRFYTRCCV